VELVLVGDCYPGYEHVVRELRDLVKNLGLDSSVRFEGFQADPSSYFLSADLVLVPSRSESFGLVALEALIHGRPVVASAVGGLPEIVVDGLTGRLVAADDPAALAEAVMSLLDDPGLAGRLAKAGRDDALRRFPVKRYATQMLEIIGDNQF
jgi:glycosyltransferase involved in cell wall biosynthesis